jgi:hypothetical protein
VPQWSIVAPIAGGVVFVTLTDTLNLADFASPAKDNSGRNYTVYEALGINRNPLTNPGLFDAGTHLQAAFNQSTQHWEAKGDAYYTLFGCVVVSCGTFSRFSLTDGPQVPTLGRCREAVSSGVQRVADPSVRTSAVESDFLSGLRVPVPRARCQRRATQYEGSRIT